MVLCCRAHHRGATDIDIFDHFVAGRTARDGLGEGIKVHHDQIDGADPVRLHRSDMLGVVAHREQAAVHGRVQGLDPPVHHFGKAGQVGHVADGQARVSQRLGRPAGRDELDAVCGERSAEIDESGFVGNRKQRTFDGNAGH